MGDGWSRDGFVPEVDCAQDPFTFGCFNSLPAIGAHERQLFDKLLWGLVTSTICVRC